MLVLTLFAGDPGCALAVVVAGGLAVYAACGLLLLGLCRLARREGGRDGE